MDRKHLIIAGAAVLLLAAGALGGRLLWPTAAHDEEEAETALHLDADLRKAHGIETARVEQQPLRDELRAPGEVRMNEYQTAEVTPRIDAQVVRRHAKLGDNVNAAAPLVTLSSVEMAEAQGALLVAEREWARVKALGQEVVSARRFLEAEVAAQKARAAVLAYGMTAAEIDGLVKTGDVSRATGEFQLVAPRRGRVTQDQFVVGQRVAAGDLLFRISDESALWVEAKLPPEVAEHLREGMPARIQATDHVLTGKVIQSYHRVDETTRTATVRISVDNRGDLLHAGDFVTVFLELGTDSLAFSLPNDAVVLVNGSPAAFVVHEDGEIEPRAVETGTTRGPTTQIARGLADGEIVVVRGAYAVKALLLKSQLGEGHGH